MPIIYKIIQQKQTRDHRILFRYFKLLKINDKAFFIIIKVKDIFGCVEKEERYFASYSASHQKYLEEGINQGKYTPIEQFSTEEHPLYEFYW